MTKKEKIHKIIYELVKIEPRIVVTGSISLYWQGLLEAFPENDIDIIVPCKETKVWDEKAGHLVSDYNILSQNLKNYLQETFEGNGESSGGTDAINTYGDEDINVDVFADIADTEVIRLVQYSADTDRKLSFGGSDYFIPVRLKDWTQIIPYKIKYYKHDSESPSFKHLASIKKLKSKLEDDPNFSITSWHTEEGKVYKEIEKFLDKYDMSQLDWPDLPY